MGTALYRRYRPDTFAQVVGQGHVTDALQAALDSGRTSHAYLFSGPRGCGKTTSARIMARCLNCAKGPTSTPCGECDSCKELAAGGSGSLDVVEIDAASHNGVDDARDLRERAIFAPTRDRYKVFILDEAHMVSTQGFNALLKLVEEPPEHVKFIFATTEPEKVIGTIRSRTHHYPFRLVAPDVLVPYLQQMCDQEGISVDEGVLDLVVRAGAGSVRDSLSVLDQLIAGSNDNHLAYAGSVALLGYTDVSLLDTVIDGLGAGDGAGVFAAVESVANSGLDPRRFVEDLLQRLRDLLICALAPNEASSILLHIPAGELQKMAEQAQAWGSRLLSRRADLVEQALREMTGTTAPRLQMELLMGRLLAAEVAEATGVSTPAPAAAPVSVAPVPKAATARAATPERTSASTSAPERVQKQAAAARASMPASAHESAPTQPQRQPAAPAVSATAGASVSPAQWEAVINAADQRSRVSGALVRQSKIVGTVGQTIYLQLQGPLAKKLQDGKAGGDLQMAITEVLGAGWNAAVSDSATLPTSAAPKAAAKSEPESKPTPAPAPGPETAAAPQSTPEPAPEPAPEPTPEPEPAPSDDQWDDEISLDDETVETGPTSGLPVVLDVLGGSLLDDPAAQN